MAELKWKDNFHYRQWEIHPTQLHKSIAHKWSYSLKISLQAHQKWDAGGLELCLFKTYVEAQECFPIVP